MVSGGVSGSDTDRGGGGEVSGMGSTHPQKSLVTAAQMPKQQVPSFSDLPQNLGRIQVGFFLTPSYA